MMVKGPLLYISLARTGGVIFIMPEEKHCTTMVISVVIAVKQFPVLFC